MASKRKKWIVALVVIAVVVLIWRLWPERPAQDEAYAAGLTKEAFAQPPNEVDAFRGMDGGGPFTPEEILGRNTWMAWAGGDEAFWDWLANNSFGTFDLLKTLSSYPCSPEQEQRARAYEASLRGGSTEEGYGKGAYGHGGYATPPGTADAYDSNYGGAAKERYASVSGGSYGAYPGVCAQTMYSKGGQGPYRYYSRDTRFCYLGLTNEPGFVKAPAPDPYGLCLDRRTGPKDGLDEKIYGRQSGVLGLRIFDNPNFDDEAKRRWQEAMKTDAFYTDPKFFSDRKLVRPYRVAMACSFCHVSPHPLNPPADPENPQLANLSGTIGAQYFWFGRIFAPNVRPDNFVWHLLDAQRPGAVDTSFVPADNLVNPRGLNAIFNVRERLANGERLGMETSAGGALLLPEVKQHEDTDYTFGVPHILWDGADSVGIDAALTRVYINIGEYHQEWIRHINPIVGLGKQSPITVEAAQKYSTFWNATQDRAVHMAQYLIRAGYPMHLANVPGGAAHLTTDAAALDRGKVVFAETCARCHSSKLPPQPQPAGGGPRLGEKGCIGSGYLDCWNNYWQWTETPQFKAQMTQMVRDPRFLEGNYLSNDARIPVTLLKTEICSSMASNAVEGHVWDNFASQSYKDLPSVGTVELFEPVQKKTTTWEAPAGGRGYQRVPSLVSVWATAPFLHNQEVGLFTGDPSVKGRIDAFNDAIHKLLNPGKRGKYVHRTDWKTDLIVQTAALPWFESAGARLLGLVDDGEIRVGPIPKGTPINLIGNINAGKNDPQVGLWTMLRTLKKVAKGLKDVKGKSEAEASARLTQLVPDLLKLSACPDFQVDRGHEFGAQLSPQDKAALIEYLKTL
jgi:hypothetical protein